MEHGNNSGGQLTPLKHISISTAAPKWNSYAVFHKNYLTLQIKQFL
jgi:hypothetical protein